MSPIQHAKLSASSAHRWLECPPSVLATQDIPDTTTIYAEEGTVAHEVAESKVRWYLCEKDIPTPNTGQFDAEEIDKYTDIYMDYVSEKVEVTRQSCPDALVLVEQRLDFSEYVPDGFGTGGIVIIADDALKIVDLKYGKGVAVVADNNPQMMLYALGAISPFGHLYGIKTVRLSIRETEVYSARRDRVSLRISVGIEDRYSEIAELSTRRGVDNSTMWYINDLFIYLFIKRKSIKT